MDFSLTPVELNQSQSGSTGPGNSVERFSLINSISVWQNEFFFGIRAVAAAAINDLFTDDDQVWIGKY